ncbi:hypothetical protein [Hydrocarboniphaga sp.]|uniref:hypothetical protein n=1 Tax=Hydrocarboniphaga sp. TaxID=2033016 RepID=UPI002ABC69DB|nr:hypothetical protein [Hydrocarboniphaga sp.]MDZ4078533.1 hypothetical protein [Hydrocarboniphaga sp.]
MFTPLPYKRRARALTRARIDTNGRPRSAASIPVFSYSGMRRTSVSPHGERASFGRRLSVASSDASLAAMSSFQANLLPMSRSHSRPSGACIVAA